MKCVTTSSKLLNCDIDNKLTYFCYIVVLAMYLHLIDAQQEHSTPTRGKAASVTAR